MTSNNWHDICITDKTGQQWYKTTASPMATLSEIRNMKIHLQFAVEFPEYYHFLDIDSAVILLDGVPYTQTTGNVDADALLKELGL